MWSETLTVVKMIWNASDMKNTTNLHNGILVFNIFLWTYDEFFFYVCSDISYFFLTFKYYKMLLFDRFKFRVEMNFVIITILHELLREYFFFEWIKMWREWNLEFNIVQSNNNIAWKWFVYIKNSYLLHLWTSNFDFWSAFKHPDQMLFKQITCW